MHIIAVTNQKGGVGKTTTTAALAGGLSERGARVLAVDIDPQCSLSDIFGAELDDVLTIADVLDRDTPTAAADVIQHTEQGDIIPSSELLEVDMSEARYQYKLAEAFSFCGGSYDYIIIDTPPALGALTINALTAADSVIISAQADWLSRRGVRQLRQTIEIVRDGDATAGILPLNERLRVLGILITRYSDRINANKLALDDILDEAAEMDTKIFDVRIRESAAIKEAHLLQRSIYAHAGKSNAATDYRALAAEVESMTGGKKKRGRRS